MSSERWPKPLPDLPDDVWADVLRQALVRQRDPYELLVEAWREYVAAQDSPPNPHRTTRGEP